MRVLILSKALVAAAYRRKLAELTRLGVEVIAVAPPEWREGGSVQRLEPSADEDYQVIVTPIRWNGHFHLHYYPELPAIMRRVRPDAAHIDEEPYNLATYLGVRAAARAGMPSLFFTWQNLPRRYPPPFRQMERAVYRKAAHAIAGSQNAARVLRAKGYSGPLSVVPQFGVDPDAFAPAEQSTRPFTAGFLNRLIPGKDPLLALEAFARLPSDARLLIAGDGPARPDVEARIQELALTDRVTLRDRVPSSEMPDLIRAVDVLLLPSRRTPSWKEQFGRILIEGMACGVPAVATDSGEIPRVVGDAGLVVPEGELEAFAGALSRLYADAGLRRALGERGRQRVLAQFTHARVAEQTLAVYRSVLDGRAGGR